MTQHIELLRELRYSCGTVSFTLVHFDNEQSPVQIAMPFFALEDIVKFLATEVPEIRKVHQDWLEFERSRLSDVRDTDQPNGLSQGMLLASV
jgi:hypothetical protein